MILCRQFRHPNILPYVGVTFDARGRLGTLVTPYMKHGNLLEFLNYYPNINCLTPVCLYYMSLNLELMDISNLDLANYEGVGVLAHLSTTHSSSQYQRHKYPSQGQPDVLPLRFWVIFYTWASPTFPRSRGQHNALDGSWGSRTPRDWTSWFSSNRHFCPWNYHTWGM